MRNIPSYEAFLGESSLSKDVDRHLEVERVRDLSRSQTLSDFVSYFMDATDGRWDEGEVEVAIKTWARKHGLKIEEAALGESRNPRTVEQTVDMMVRDLVKMGADEKTARAMYQPADVSVFRGYAVEGMRSRKHRRGVAWTATVTKDGRPVCGVRQTGIGGDNFYDVVDQELYGRLQADAKRAFPKDFEAVDTFVSLLDSMTNESAVNEAGWFKSGLGEESWKRGDILIKTKSSDRVRGTDPTHKVGEEERRLVAAVVAAAKALVAKPKDRKLARAYMDAMTACMGMGWNPDDSPSGYIYYTVPGKPKVFDKKADAKVVDDAMEICFEVFDDPHDEGMKSWKRAELL